MCVYLYGHIIVQDKPENINFKSNFDTSFFAKVFVGKYQTFYAAGGTWEGPAKGDLKRSSWEERIAAILLAASEIRLQCCFVGTSA